MSKAKSNGLLQMMNGLVVQARQRNLDAGVELALLAAKVEALPPGWQAAPDTGPAAEWARQLVNDLARLAGGVT
jgi:hypothetical protein